MSRTFTALAGLALLAGPALTGCVCGEQRRLDHGGITRTYLLHLPEPRPEDPVPLVVALHGRGGTGNSQRRSTGYNALADRDGVAVVYPDGVDRSWADARDVSPAHEQGVDDEAFLLALIDAVGEEIDVDPERIAMMGISNGGFMTQTMACDHGDKLAAAASVISTIPRSLADACNPPRPLSVLFMNGTEDPLVPFEGGVVDSDVGGEIIGSDAAAAHWVAHNNCGSSPGTETVDERDDETSIQIERYDGCDGDTAVHYYKVEGGGHTWPSGEPYAPEGMIGRVSEEIEGMEVIWTFLLAQRRAPAGD